MSLFPQASLAHKAHFTVLFHSLCFFFLFLQTLRAAKQCFVVPFKQTTLKFCSRLCFSANTMSDRLAEIIRTEMILPNKVLARATDDIMPRSAINSASLLMLCCAPHPSREMLRRCLSPPLKCSEEQDSTLQPFKNRNYFNTRKMDKNYTSLERFKSM